MVSQTAIEYGGRSVRLLEFDGSARKLRVLGIHDVSLDVPRQVEGGPDPDDLRAKAIAEAMDEAGFTTDPSGMAFDAGHAMFREFSLPFTNDEQIAKVVRFESESHFPGDIEELILQHVVLRKLKDKSHLLVAAVRKDDLLDRLDILEESGLDPQFVDIDVFSMFHALVGTGVASSKPRLVVINAQESTATLMFLVDGKLFGVRSIRIGTHGVTTDGGETDAARAERTAGGAAPRAAGRAAAVTSSGASASATAVAAETDIEVARTHDYLTRVSREIRRTLTTLPEFGQADGLLVTGSGSRLEGFDKALSGIFGVTAEPLNLLEYVDHKLSPDEVNRYGQDIGDVLGVAFKLAGLDILRTDFRREEAAYARKFDQIKMPLIVLALMIFLSVAFLALGAYLDASRLKDEYAKNILAIADQQLSELLIDDEAALAAARSRVARAEFGPKRVQALVTEIKALSEDIKQKLGRSTTIKELPSALGAWIELFEVISVNEDPLGRMALDRVDVEASGKEPTIKINGKVEDLTHLTKFMDALKERPMFTDVSVGPTKPTSDGALGFTELNIKLDLSRVIDVAETP